MRNIRLTQSNLEDLAVETGIDLHSLSVMNVKGLIDNSTAIDMLVRSDFRKLKNKRRYTTKMIIIALEKKYRISHTKIVNAIYDKRRAGAYYCQCCGNKITKTVYEKNEKLCDKCLTDQLALE